MIALEIDPDLEKEADVINGIFDKYPGIDFNKLSISERKEILWISTLMEKDMLFLSNLFLLSVSYRYCSSLGMNKLENLTHNLRDFLTKECTK